MNPLVFKIHHLLEKPPATREDYSFDGPVEFDEIKTLSDLSGEVEIMRIEDGVNVKVTNVKIAVETKCSRCSKPVEENIKIPFAERQFYLEAVENPEDPCDQYTINRKNFTIDLTELLRQEIILHFSELPVCLNGCKIEYRNTVPPSCDGETFQNKPLAKLKDLIKENHGKTCRSKEKNS